jgi:hypothetical protein
MGIGSEGEDDFMDKFIVFKKKKSRTDRSESAAPTSAPSTGCRISTQLWMKLNPIPTWLWMNLNPIPTRLWMNLN